MGSKIGVILTMPFLFIAFLFGIDFVSLQLTYTSLDSISTTVSYRISKIGGIDDTIKDYVRDEICAEIEAVYPGRVYNKGSTYEYYLFKEFTPLFMSNSSKELRIKRFTVIGINN